MGAENLCLAGAQWGMIQLPDVRNEPPSGLGKMNPGFNITLAQMVVNSTGRGST